MADSGNIHLAWLDAHMYIDSNKELLGRIREVNKEAMEFTEEDECLRFLGRGVADPRRFIFVVSGQLGEKLVPEIQERDNVLSIYVFCGYREKHEAWAKKYSKVKVVTQADELLSGLKSDQVRFKKK